MLYNSGPSVEDGSSGIRGGQVNIAGTTSTTTAAAIAAGLVVLPTATSDATCSGGIREGNAAFLNPQFPGFSPSLAAGGADLSTNGGLGLTSPTSSSSLSSSSSSSRTQQPGQGLGQFCQPGTHQQHFPTGTAGHSQGYQPQPHVTVSYAGAYNPSVGVGGGGGGVVVGKGPLHAAQNPHWTHRHHPGYPHHHHPGASASASASVSSAKQHHSWMANYHGFVTPIR